MFAYFDMTFNPVNVLAVGVFSIQKMRENFCVRCYMYVIMYGYVIRVYAVEYYILAYVVPFAVEVYTS